METDHCLGNRRHTNHTQHWGLLGKKLDRAACAMDYYLYCCLNHSPLALLPKLWLSMELNFHGNHCDRRSQHLGISDLTNQRIGLPQYQFELQWLMFRQYLLFVAPSSNGIAVPKTSHNRPRQSLSAEYRPKSLTAKISPGSAPRI
jgi:hypothetical protein